MKKIWLIGWKDVVLAARDPSALVFMLAAPFLLTLGMGLVTGRFSSADSGPSGIPVVVVNQDGGQLGTALIDVFESEALSTLLTTTVLDSPDAAREQVESDEAAAAVIVPEGFTNSIIPEQGAAPTGDVVQIELYAKGDNYQNEVYVLPKHLDEKVARLHLEKLGAKLTKMSDEQAAYIGVSPEGPYKAEHYRY